MLPRGVCATLQSETLRLDEVLIIMRKIAIALGVAAIAVVIGQSGKLGILGDYVKAFQDAKSLKANFTIARVGEASSQYSIELSKPNKVRFDSPTELIVADGKTVTTLSKAENTYYTQPQDAGWHVGAISGDTVHLFAPFFNKSALDNAKVLSTAPKKRLGMDLTAVETQLDARGNLMGTYYLDSGKTPRQLEFFYKDNNSRVQVTAKDLTLGAEALPDSTFQFTAPAGSRQLTLEEMNSDKWYHDLEEAKKVAAKTKRLIMIDFMAEW